MNGKIEQHQQAVIVDPDVTILERSEVTHIGKCTREGKRDILRRGTRICNRYINNSRF